MKPIAKARLEKELQMFMAKPTPGIACTCNDDSLRNLTAEIIGTEGSPFEKGIFNLDILIPDRYPFEPPCVRFVTPVYHPNIDSQGRICLDTLKLPPQGSWKPNLNLSLVLMMIRLLLNEPGTNDPLMADIWQEYKYDYPKYAQTARQWTQKYARLGNGLDLNPDTNTNQALKKPTPLLPGTIPPPPTAIKVKDKGGDGPHVMMTSSSSSALHDDTNLLPHHHQDPPPAPAPSSRKRQLLGLKVKCSRKSEDVTTNVKEVDGVDGDREIKKEKKDDEDE